MEPVQEQATLYDKLGGEFTIRKLVDEFYTRVLGDPDLSPVFEGKDINRLKRHQALFLSQALGGPKEYDGREMEVAHKGLGISDAQFDKVAQHLVDTLADLGVASDNIQLIVALVAPLKSAIVERQPSLYDKLGGEGAIKSVVEGFYQRVLADPLLSPIFEGKDINRLKRHQALFLSQALGGPKEYDGRSMFDAHKDFLISEQQFGSVAGHLVETLRGHDVGQEDIDTVIGAIAPLKTDIVMDHFTRWLKGG